MKKILNLMFILGKVLVCLKIGIGNRLELHCLNDYYELVHKKRNVYNASSMLMTLKVEFRVYEFNPNFQG